MKQNNVWIMMLILLLSCTAAHAQSSAPKELKSVNAMALTFIKANGKPVDFKIGLAISDSTDITVMVDVKYEISELKVVLIRGKAPVSASTYNSESSEVGIEWKDFANAQPGDRLCIDFVIVKERKGNERIPVELDVSVFNIPLN